MIETDQNRRKVCERRIERALEDGWMGCTYGELNAALTAHHLPALVTIDEMNRLLEIAPMTG